uniref:ULP_PROTEASE domain-containing protein n=1 Tax=Ascaris lumbricoides TaxID=6252 RepID=A0A0M3I1H9_ASCLU
MQFGLSSRLRRDASRYLNKQIEATSEPHNDSIPSTVNSNIFPSSTSQRSKTSPTNATAHVGNRKRPLHLVERDDAKPAYTPRLVAVTKTPKLPSLRTPINRSKLMDVVENEQYKRQPIRIMPQIKDKKPHNVVARDEPLFEGNDLVGDLSTFLTGGAFAPPNQVDNVQSSLSAVQEMRQPVMFENQSPSLNPSSINFEPAIFAQGPAIVSQNFGPQAMPIMQNPAVESSSIPQSLTPQFAQQEQVIPQNQLYFIETSGTDLNPQPQLVLLRPIPPDASLQQPMQLRPETVQFPPPPFSLGQMPSVTNSPPIPRSPHSLEPFPTLPPEAQQTSTSAPQTPTISFRIRERTEVFSPETQQPQTTTTDPYYTTEAIALRIFAHFDAEPPNTSSSTDLELNGDANASPERSTIIGTNEDENDRERSAIMNEEGSKLTQEIDSPHLKARSINQRKRISEQNSNTNEAKVNEEENTSYAAKRITEILNETTKPHRVIKVVRKGARRSSAINRSSLAPNPIMIRNASETSMSTITEQRLLNARNEQVKTPMSVDSIASTTVTDSSIISTNLKNFTDTK